MAEANTSIGVSLNPLMKEETRVYVDTQKRADKLKNFAQYMFWGATSIAGALALGFITKGGLAGLAIGTMFTGGQVLAAGLIASAITFLGSVILSSKATELSEKSAVLYSDIDSQNQAHRMVQAFAKAQHQDQQVETSASSPFTGQTSWAERTGKPASQKAGWVARIAEQAQREDAVALQALKGR